MYEINKSKMLIFFAADSMGDRELLIPSDDEFEHDNLQENPKAPKVSDQQYRNHQLLGIVESVKKLSYKGSYASDVIPRRGKGIQSQPS